MTSKAQQLISFFKKHGGIARFAVILKAGFHSDSLVALQKGGKVEKMGRGIYRLTQEAPMSNPDLVMASLSAPRAVVCLISALAFHDATDEIPRHVDLAIPRRTHANKIVYPPVRYYRFAPEAWKAGVEQHKMEKHFIRVYSLAKTVVDCFKFRNKIGMDVARHALKVAIKEKRVPAKEIMYFAKVCRVANIIKPILETML